MPQSQENTGQSTKWEGWLVGALFISFLFRTLYFAMNTGADLPPDEVTHAGITQLHANTFLLPQDSPASYRFGLVTHVPYLYYLLLGWLLKLNVFGVSTYIFLRIINVILSMTTVFFSYRLAKLLSNNPLVSILFLAMLTNTLMFTFLSGSINYDNLTNLLAALSLYFLFRFFFTENMSSLLNFLIFIFLGCITKITFLPYAPFLLLIYLFERRNSLKKDFKGLFSYVVSRRLAPTLLGPLLIILLFANLKLYGTNLILFGKIYPSCDQVLSVDNCMENRIYSRNKIHGDYRKGLITLAEAVESAKQIKNPGDMRHTLNLLENERVFKISKPEPMNVYDYMYLVWDQAMKPTIFGILAHKPMTRNKNQLLYYNLLIMLVFILWVRYSRYDGSEKYFHYLAAIFVFYFLFFVAYFNYSLYLVNHAHFLGVQGRYLFPVIVPAYLFAAHYLLSPFNKKIQIFFLIPVAVLFICGDFPFFTSQATGEWFWPKP